MTRSFESVITDALCEVRHLTTFASCWQSLMFHVWCSRITFNARLSKMSTFFFLMWCHMGKVTIMNEIVIDSCFCEDIFDNDFCKISFLGQVVILYGWWIFLIHLFLADVATFISWHDNTSGAFMHLLLYAQIFCTLGNSTGHLHPTDLFF